MFGWILSGWWLFGVLLVAKFWFIGEEAQPYPDFRIRHVPILFLIGLIWPAALILIADCYGFWDKVLFTKKPKKQPWEKKEKWHMSPRTKFMWRLIGLFIGINLLVWTIIAFVSLDVFWIQNTLLTSDRMEMHGFLRAALAIAELFLSVPLLFYWFDHKGRYNA